MTVQHVEPVQILDSATEIDPFAELPVARRTRLANMGRAGWRRASRSAAESAVAKTVTSCPSGSALRDRSQTRLSTLRIDRGENRRTERRDLCDRHRQSLSMPGRLRRGPDTSNAPPPKSQWW